MTRFQGLSARAEKQRRLSNLSVRRVQGKLAPWYSNLGPSLSATFALIDLKKLCPLESMIDCRAKSDVFSAGSSDVWILGTGVHK